MINLKVILELCNQAITKDIWNNDKESTTRFRKVFSQFAERHNFRPQYAKHPKEFLAIDMVWWDNQKLVAVIEHENVPAENPIDDEWKKLMYVHADYKILISYCSTEDKRKRWLKRASEIVVKAPTQSVKGYYLVLGDETFWDFRGYKYHTSGNYASLAST